MAVVNSAPVEATYVNSKLMSRTEDTGTVGKVSLENPDSSPIQSAQDYINQLAETVGINENDLNRLIYNTDNYLSNGSDIKFNLSLLDVALLGVDGSAQAAQAAADAAQTAIDNHLLDLANPHQTDKTQVGLGNVTDDAQLKREAGDFNTFPAKATPVTDDIILLEDSADSFEKKKITLSNLISSNALTSQDFTLTTANGYLPSPSTGLIEVFATATAPFLEYPVNVAANNRVFNGSSVIGFANTATLTTTRDITAVSFYVTRSGNPGGSANVKIYNTSGGIPTTLIATSNTVLNSDFSTLGDYFTFTFASPVNLVAGTYAFSIELFGGYVFTAGVNFLALKDAIGSPIAGVTTTTFNGTTWTTFPQTMSSQFFAVASGGSLRGITSIADKKSVFIRNKTNGVLTLRSFNSANGDFNLLQDLEIPDGRFFQTIYDPLINRWSLAAGSASGGSGGIVSVNDLTERDAINPASRTEGLLVYVSSNQTTYQLSGGILNSNWIVLGREIVSTQSALTAAGSAVLNLTAPKQTLVVAGSGGPVTLSAQAFGINAPLDGAEIVLIGSSDSNSVRINRGTGAKEVSINGDFVELFLHQSITLKYISSLDIYIEIARSH